MVLSHPRRLPDIVIVVAILCLPILASGNSLSDKGTTNTEIVGTWRGQSICVGYRPACKNEEIVYRFVMVSGRTDLVTLYADKILEGKRVPMGKLDLAYDKAKGSLTAEFTRRQTHGEWRYQLTGDNLEGTLMLLPDKQTVRTVKAHRTTEDQVPEAPPLTEYEARGYRDRLLIAIASGYVDPIVRFAFGAS